MPLLALPPKNTRGKPLDLTLIQPHPIAYECA